MQYSGFEAISTRPSRQRAESFGYASIGVVEEADPGWTGLWSRGGRPERPWPETVNDSGCGDGCGGRERVSLWP